MYFNGRSYKIVFALFFAFLAPCAFAQSPSNQLNQFGEIQNLGVDSIDLTSLTARFDLILMHKAGRGQDLDLKVSYAADSILSYPLLGWTPVLQGLVGKVSYTIAGCSPGHCGYTNWIYTDLYGTQHHFRNAVYAVPGGATKGTADDGTGLVITPGLSISTISGPDGGSWQVPSAQTGKIFIPSGNRQDSNGNTISETSTSITDTLGWPIQVVNYTQVGHALTNPPSETYTYPDATGTSRTVAVNSAVYNLYLNVPVSPCSGAYQGAHSTESEPYDLPNSIMLPNGTGYTFQYEALATPANTTTGRISQIGLPTGGSITYTYPSASSLVQSYQSCADSGVFFLNRTTADGTWQYTRTLSNYGYSACVIAGNCSSYPPPIATTTVVDPKGNTSVYTFMYYPLPGYLNYTYLETSKAVYQGPATGTPLFFQQTCYNGFAPPCAAEDSVNLPNASTYIISTKDVYRSYNGGPNARTTTTYENPLYIPVEVDEYDFGAATPTRKTFTSYLSVSGVQTNKVASVIVKDGNNNILQQAKYGYDETTVAPTSQAPQHAAVTGNRGNLTSTSVWRKSDGVWLKATYTNDDTGNRLTGTDSCGNTTCSDMTGSNHTATYSYSDSPSGANAAGNSDAYLTQVMYPNTGVAHIENYQYSYNSGGRTQSMDQNNVVTKYSYNDPLNRLKLVDNAVGKLNWYEDLSAESMTSYTYPSATEVDVAQDQLTTGDAVLKSSTFSDGLGRPIKTVGRDRSVVETGYDAYDRVCAVSNPTFNDPGPLSCSASKKSRPHELHRRNNVLYL
jgi:hypothetical protein